MRTRMFPRLSSRKSSPLPVLLGLHPETGTTTEDTMDTQTFGVTCPTCGEFNATRVCLACLVAKTGATITGGPRGTVVIMPNAVRGYPY